MMSRQSLLLSLLIAVVASVSLEETSLAQEHNELALTTAQVIVFKDGYCLIVKRGVGHASEAGEVFTDEVPDAAVLGSFWAVPETGQIVSTLAGFVISETAEEIEASCQNHLEILWANQGSRVSIELANGNAVQGTIPKVLASERQVAVAPSITSTSPESIHAPPFPPRGSDSDRRNTVTMTDYQGSHFILRREIDDADMLLSAADVRSITLPAMKSTLPKTVKSKRQTKRLTCKTDTPNREIALTIMYFRPGIRWIPTYRIALDAAGRENMAEISLQAEIINEAEDLIDGGLDLVVGAPNFRFNAMVSPLVLESVLRNALAEAAPTLSRQMMNNQFSNALVTQRPGEVRQAAPFAEEPTPPGGMTIPSELGTVGIQDFFVYKFPKTSIRQHERAALNIFSIETPYRNVYTWTATINRNDIEATVSGAGVRSPITLSKNEVWHQIEFVNQSEVPLTTGAALVTQGNQPLAQELLAYTSIGSTCRLPVTVAVDLRGTFDDREVGRTLQALTSDGHTYAKIEKEARVRLLNHKSSNIQLEATVRLGGRATEASRNGAIELSTYQPDLWTQYRGNPALNNTSHISWKAEIPAGETFDAKLLYHYYLRQ